MENEQKDEINFPCKQNLVKPTCFNSPTSGTTSKYTQQLHIKHQQGVYQDFYRHTLKMKGYFKSAKKTPKRFCRLIE
jgi:hypothetical protein